jgi:hypothetical protein
MTGKSHVWDGHQLLHNNSPASSTGFRSYFFQAVGLYPARAERSLGLVLATIFDASRSVRYEHYVAGKSKRQ